MKKSVIDKYLANYCEPEVRQLANISLPKMYTYSVVIPAYQETSTFVSQFVTGSLASINALIIVVINQPEHDTDNLPQITLQKELEMLGESTYLSAEITYVDLKKINLCSNALLIINRYTRPTPSKQGVGLARKIGCDIACWLFNVGNITSQYIASTDADALLPVDYFTQQNMLTNKHSAACYNFTHISDDKAIHDATQQYETALRYYVAGLTYANSSYAFFTIGSILLFDAKAYANVRGFPKKSAGEDFYLLNKLAKMGDVAFFKASHVRLTARLSSRVPFGTGPAVLKIIHLTEQEQAYCYYHPSVFSELKQLNSCVLYLYEYLKDPTPWLSKLPESTQEALTSIGFHDFINKHSNDKKTQFNKQWYVWFDAFKTLKFIHALREIQFPDIPLTQALQLKNFVID